MASRCLSLIACVSFGLMAVGCGEQRKLTADRAKAALIELLRSTELDYLHGFPVDDFASKAVKHYPDGTAWWAGFHFDLKAGTYSYHVERGDPGDKSHFAAQYEGTFKFKDGKWVAEKANWKWIT